MIGQLLIQYRQVNLLGKTIFLALFFSQRLLKEKLVCAVRFSYFHEYGNGACFELYGSCRRLP